MNYVCGCDVKSICLVNGVNVYFFDKIIELEVKGKMYGWLYIVIVLMNGLCLLKD